MKFKIFFRKREDIVEVNIFFETEIFLRKFKVSKKKKKKKVDEKWLKLKWCSEFFYLIFLSIFISLWTCMKDIN